MGSSQFPYGEQKFSYLFHLKKIPYKGEDESDSPAKPIKKGLPFACGE